MGLVDDIRAAVRGGILSLAASIESSGGDDVSFEQMHDALIKAGVAEPTDEKPRALFHDPYSIMDWGGWRQRPSSLTYETIRQMADQNTVCGAIIKLRVDQVAQFARPQQGPYDKGFRIILRDRRDTKRTMTKAEVQRATEIERMLETTGFLLPEERPSDRDSFKAFLKKSVRDILTYDQWVFEILRDRQGRPSRFICLPAETIRPAVSDIEHQDPAERRSRVSHVQVYENTIIAEFAQDDIAWCVMNPRSDLRANGFGFSPIEGIVRLVTAWLYGFEYNTKFFTQGSAIKGLINIKGAIPDRQMRAFRRMWYTMISGVQNSWKTPILNSEDIQWVNMHSTNREMEYGAWMDWLTKLTCAMFGVDPLEINFIFGGQGTAQSAMFDRRPNQAEVTESKDKGLRPLVEHIEDSLNHHLIWELEPDFEFAFTGLDAKAEQKERDARAIDVKTCKTVNQIRTEMGFDPLPDEEGDILLDPTFLQWKMNLQGQQQGMEGEGGPLGAVGAAGAEDDSEGDQEDDDHSDLLGAGGERLNDDEDDEQDLLAASLYSLANEALKKAKINRKLLGERQVIEIEAPGRK